MEDPNAIWAADEVCDVLAYDADDGRKVPEYSFYYKQAVQTGDVYLGLDPMGKDPTSNSCEDLVLTVELPDATSASDIDVDLASSSITLLTSKQCVVALSACLRTCLVVAVQTLKLADFVDTAVD